MSNSAYLFSISALFIVAVIVYLQILGQRRTKRENEENQQQVMKWVEHFVSVGIKYIEIGIPEITSSLKFKSTEKLYGFVEGVEWLEHRKVSTGNYSAHGVTGRIKIAKGLSYRFGSGQIFRETFNQLTTIDTGDLYFTNNGILFRGAAGNKTIAYDKIIMINPATNHIKIERATGKDIYLHYNFQQSPEVLSALFVAWNKDYFKQFEEQNVLS
jgi:hypothetical protein